jgi:hypothetical protein
LPFDLRKPAVSRAAPLEITGEKSISLAHHLEICEFLYTSAIIRSVLKLPSTIEFLKDLLGGDARI